MGKLAFIFPGQGANMWEWEKIFMKNFLFADRL